MAEKKKRKNEVNIGGYSYQKISRKVGMKQNKAGKWVPDYKNFYGKTNKEAVAKYEDYMTNKCSGSLNGSTCFGEFISWWTENIYLQDSSLAAGTKTLHVNSYHNIFDDSYVIGNAVKQITGADLQSVLTSASCGATTKRHARSFLKRFYTYLESQHITSDITGGLVIPKVQHRKADQTVETFSEEEIRKFLDSTPADHRQRLMIVLAIYTGARIGELCALTYDDISNGVMNINKALLEIDPIITERGTTKARVEISETKTKSSVRTIPLEPLDYIQNEIDQHRKWHRAEMLKRGYRTEYVFTTSSGELYFKSTLRTAFARLCKSLEIDDTDKSMHTFRHTFGSNLAKAGEPIQTVAKLMGHDNISVTAKYYINIDEDEKRNAVRKLSFG